MLQTNLFGAPETISTARAVSAPILSAQDMVNAGRSDKARPKLEKIKDALVSVLERRGPLDLDKLAILAGYSPQDAAPALTELRLSGAVFLNSKRQISLA